MGSIVEAGSAFGKIVVVGGNTVSTPIIHTLEAHDFTVHHVVRNLDSHGHAGHDHKTYTSDFSQASLEEILLAVKPDLVISSTISRSFDSQKAIIDAVVDTHIPQFIPAEFGDDVLNERLRKRLPKLEERAKTIHYLQDLAAEGRLSYVAIATGCLLDEGLQTGRLGFELKWQSATMHGSGSEEFAASSSAWVGKVVVAAIRNWERVRNQYLYAASVITSANETLQCLEKTTGEQWEAGRGEVVDCVREAERRIDRGFPDAGMFLMERSVLYDEALGGLKPFVERDAKKLLGLEGEPLDGIVEAALHKHGHQGPGGCGCD